MINKTIVIGLDGGTFAILDPLIDAGRLPNIKKIIDTGVKSVLKSVTPPVTGPAWTSFMTGKNPANHGVIEWLIKKKEALIYFLLIVIQ